MSKSSVMREMYDSGKSVSEISKEMNCNYSYVYGVIDRHTNGSIKQTVKDSKSDLFRQMYDDGSTVGEIAKQTNSNYSYVFSVIKKHREK